jgi:hypothetical protein
MLNESITSTARALDSSLKAKPKKKNQSFPLWLWLVGLTHLVGHSPALAATSKK